jgi:Ca-activated chloride channel family protein
MNFLWPQNLWLLLALPLLPAMYLWLLRRRGKPALRLSSLGLVRKAMTRQWRRHIPPALFLLAFFVVLIALARPTASVALPWARSTIMLAMDASLSMRVKDVQPTRMVAAQEAAKSFLPRSFLKRPFASLSAPATQRSVICPSFHRLTLRVK